MSEPGFYEFKTETRFTDPESEYLKNLGVTKLAHRDVMTVKTTEDGIEICTGSELEHHYGGKMETRIEKLPNTKTCAQIPNELLEKLKDLLREGD